MNQLLPFSPSPLFRRWLLLAGRLHFYTNLISGDAGQSERGRSANSALQSSPPAVKLSHLWKVCPPLRASSAPAPPWLGFSLENNKPSSLLLVPVQCGKRKMRSKWQAVQLSFEPNRWWRLSDSSVTASFEVIGDNLYFESELDHCQKGRRLICKRFYISPCFLGFLRPPTPPWILVSIILAPGYW